MRRRRKTGDATTREATERVHQKIAAAARLHSVILQNRAALRRQLLELKANTQALSETLSGGVPSQNEALPNGDASHHQNDALLAPLTPREREVLRLVGEGKRTKEIAEALGIAFKTAACHRGHIMEKLGVHEGPMLVRYAIRAGLCNP